MASIKVILLQQIPKLGKRGDVVNVAEGYARNFLFAKRLAQVVTPQAMEHVALERKKIDDTKRERERDIEKIAKRLDGQRVQTSEKTDDKGHLYGSVSAHRVADLIRHLGYEVQDEWVKLEHPLKTVGEHTVEIKFPGGKMASIVVEIQTMN